MTKLIVSIAGFVALTALLLGAASGQTRDNRQSSARGSQINFIYPRGLVLAIDAQISVDGRRIASIGKGEFHVTSVAPGTHQIQIENAITSASTADVTLAPGEARYFIIGPAQHYAPGMQLLTTLMAGTKGTPVQGRRGLNPGYSFYAVDAAEGRAEIAKLRGAR